MRRVISWALAVCATAASFAIYSDGHARDRAAASSSTADPASPVSPFAVVAQAGSAGGTIGKQGKSLSGEENVKPPAPPRRKSSGARNSASRQAALAGFSLAGRWHWEANCNNGPGNGIFTLRETSPGEFSGEFGNTNHWDRGTIVGGKVAGNQVSFVSQYVINRTWTATLSRASGLRMKGSFSGPESCTFSAVKN